MNPIRTFGSAEFGITASIYTSATHGYTVALRDEEAGETAPYVRGFRDYSKAEEYARSLVRS